MPIEYTVPPPEPLMFFDVKFKRIHQIKQNEFFPFCWVNSAMNCTVADFSVGERESG